MENNEMRIRLMTMDLLMTTKFAMISTTSALMETATPEVREILSKQLQNATHFHAALSDLAGKRGWYDAYDMETQIRNDARLAQWVYQIE
ncbi:spore coat protein [Sulfoacidibacillus thermotolerans]|uniref:Spore coat protein n=1 Tax=Sulfoacidibacillus thermotolerans TaxID=1765684 RepID=A0A2U3DBQ3_SULT2|nr:spore coat protein [Sulfoacidibacillus thermotolerans]PWI58707.1 hypothetical protein BM613_01000 [Sulfoacidibacillus thermotolerans]